MKQEDDYSNIKQRNWLKYVVFISLIFSVTHVYAAQTVDEILNEYYPIYNEAKQCRGIIANNGSSSG